MNYEFIPAYRIGQLGKPHGVHGEINFAFTSDVWDRVEAEYLLLETDGILVPFFLEEYRFRGEHSALLKFLDIDSIDDVQEYSGCEVFFPYALTPEDDDADYTWQYFVDFRVEDESFGSLGNIVRVDDSTSNVLFELADGQLIPATEDFIRDIDHEQRVIHMSLPEGLLEL